MKNISTDGSGNSPIRRSSRRAAAAKVNYTDTRIIHDVNVYETSNASKAPQYIKSFSGSDAGSDSSSSSSGSSS